MKTDPAPLPQGYDTCPRCKGLGFVAEGVVCAYCRGSCLVEVEDVKSVKVTNTSVVVRFKDGSIAASSKTKDETAEQVVERLRRRVEYAAGGSR